MSIVRSLAIPCLSLIVVTAYAEGVPDDCTQLIVGVAPTWNSMRGELRLLERPRGGEWAVVAGPFPALFGKSGLAWGTCLAGQNEPGLRKKERDGRAPAGVFEIGQVFGYNAHLPPGADYPYHQVTEQTFGTMIRAHRITIATSSSIQRIRQTITRAKKCARATSRMNGWLRSDTIPIPRCPAREARFFFIFAAA